jgi:Ca2+-binding EF-hand superfamily protein
MPDYIRPSARDLSPELLEKYRQAFTAFDDDRDGRVATELLGKVLRAIGFNPQPREVEDMVEDIKEPEFTFKTFLYLTFRHGREVDPAGELIEAFRVLDKSGSGSLKTSEIRNLLKNLRKPLTNTQVEDLLRKAAIAQDPAASQAEEIDEKEVIIPDEIEYKGFVQIMLEY